MLDGQKGMAQKCAKVIYNVLIMTRIKDKQGLVETMARMCESAENSPEHTEEMRKVYRVVYNFFKQVWKEDLDAIIEIVFGKQKK